MSPAPRYRDFQGLQRELEPFLSGGRRLPSKRFFESIHRGDIITDVRRHGGWQEVRTKLGQPQVKRAGKDSYAVWENAKRRLEELGFPPWGELGRLDNPLYSAISRHHGGYIAVKRRCGKPVAIGWGLEEWENIKPLLDEIMREHNGNLPPADDLVRSKKPRDRAVYTAINDHHDGMAAVRERMGLNLKYFSGTKSLRYKENLDAVLKPLVETLGYFPSASQLKGLKLERITHACEIYHGGLDAVRNDYGYQPIQKRGADSLRHWKNMHRELSDIILLLGHFPILREMHLLGKDYVYAAMHYHGGIDAVRKRFGAVPPYKRGFDSLRFWENYSRELAVTVKTLGHFPSQKELENLGRFDVLGASRLHEGLVQSRRLFEAAVKRGEIRLEDAAAPRKREPVEEEVAPRKREPAKQVSTVKLLALLEAHEVGIEQISGSIFAKGDCHFIIPAPLYTSLLAPIPLHTCDGVLVLEQQHARLASLFIQLSSARACHRLKATRIISELAKTSSTRGEFRDALFVLRNAFMNEQDKHVRKEMHNVLESKQASKFWRQ